MCMAWQQDDVVQIGVSLLAVGQGTVLYTAFILLVHIGDVESDPLPEKKESLPL